MASSNLRQVIVYLHTKELIYFEVDEVGRLEEMANKMLPTEVTCLHMPAVPEGRSRARFLAVGCDDKTLKILSLDPEAYLERSAIQALPDNPTSACLIEMQNQSSMEHHHDS